MTKKVFILLFKIFLTLIIFIINIGIANLLPQPWNHINLIILIAIWLLIFRNQFEFIRYLFVLSIISELFHSTPFGLNTAALIITVAALDWLLLNLLTNRFFLIVFVAGVLSIIIYRLTAILLLYLSSFIIGGSVNLSQSFLLTLFLEALVNGVILVIAYLVPTIYTKKFNPSYLNESDYGHRSAI